MANALQVSFVKGHLKEVQWAASKHEKAFIADWYFPHVDFAIEALTSLEYAWDVTFASDEGGSFSVVVGSTSCWRLNRADPWIFASLVLPSVQLLFISSVLNPCQAVCIFWLNVCRPMTGWVCALQCRLAYTN